MTSKRERGFVLLVVMVLLAALSVVTAARLEVLRAEAGATTRREEEGAARAWAEACMEQAHALVQAYASHTSATHPLPPVDFDGLLDPDPGVAGDEHAPGAPWVGVTVGGQRFGLLRQDQSGAQPRLQCLVRFEDDADDAAPNDAVHPAAATSNTAGVLEGPAAGGADVPTRDRDRAIVVTVVGLAPFFAADVADGDVYGRAHARVTLRRWFQSRGAPAVFAGGDATFDEDVAICGNGGVQADAAAFGGGSCACGSVVASTGGVDDCADDDSDAACGADPSSCAELDVASIGPQPDPPPAPVAAYALSSPSSWIDAPAVRMGDPGACRFRLTPKSGSTPAVGWLWDRTSPTCAAVEPAAIPAPCPYDAVHFPAITALDDAVAPRPDGVACAAPAACWRPIFVDDGQGRAWEMTNATGPVAGEKMRFDDVRLAYWSTSMTATQRPIDDPASLPALTWEAMCTGATTGRALAPDDAFWFTSSDRWRVSDVDRDGLPWPAVFGVDGALRVDGDVGDDEPPVWRVMATGTIDLDTNVRMCCPTCRCATVPATIAQCTNDDPAVQAFLPAEGVVLGGEGLCRVDNRVALFGEVRCGSFRADNDACVLGGIATSSTLPSGVSCPAGDGADCASGVGVCLKNHAYVVGDTIADGSICLQNDATVTGTVWSNDDVVFENQAEIVGQIVAGDDVHLEAGTSVVFDGVRGVGGGARPMAWAEAAW